MKSGVGSHRRSGLTLILTLGLVAGACAIPAGEPQALPHDEHEDLLVGTSTTTAPPANEEVDIMLYFISSDGDKLESVIRPYEANPKVNRVLKDLESPPRDEEQDQFQDRGLVLRTEVYVDLNATLQTSADEDGQSYRTIRVDAEAGLREQLRDEPAQARLAVSQLVCTVLPLLDEDVSGVQLIDDQGEIKLTDAATQPIDGPATIEHFGDCKTGTEQLSEQLETETSEESTDSTTESTTESTPSTDPLG